MKHIRRNILTLDNAKTSKGEDLGYITGISYLVPYKMAQKGINLCPSATKQCFTYCLINSGRGRFTKTKQARLNKTRYFLNDINGYMFNLIKDIQALVRKCERENKKPCVRLNGTSDINWLKIKHAPSGKTIFDIFPNVQFYDYTKRYDLASSKLPENYHLTYSYSGRNLAGIGNATA
jgi:hypothetical protein